MSLPGSPSWPEVLTVRPLAAISGRVRVAGVVSRLRALVSCSITASISWGRGELVTAAMRAAGSGPDPSATNPSIMKQQSYGVSALVVLISGPEPPQSGMLVKDAGNWAPAGGGGQDDCTVDH